MRRGRRLWGVLVLWCLVLVARFWRGLALVLGRGLGVCGESGGGGRVMVWGAGRKGSEQS